MVSEKDFFGKSGKEDNGMTSDLTADKERLTNERRKRKQLERVRQVERTKRRLKRGILSGFLVMVLGLGAIRWYQDRQTEEMWQEAYPDEAGSDAGQLMLSDPEARAGYLDMLQSLADSDERYRQILNREEEYPDKVLRMVCQNEETLGFAVDYPEMKGSKPADTVGDVTTGVIPLLIQWDRQ